MFSYNNDYDKNKWKGYDNIWDNNFAGSSNLSFNIFKNHINNTIYNGNILFT